MLLITGANGRLGRLIVEEVLRRARDAPTLDELAAAKGIRLAVEPERRSTHWKRTP